ncbi:MAG: hypothetical protein AAFQ04_01585 [Pseudomonadota bacterium]
MFLSISGEFDVQKDITDEDKFFTSLFFERGLKNNLTFGLDAGTRPFGDPEIIAFLRYPISPLDQNARYSLEFGVGTFDGEVAIQPGFSWGRGIKLREINGWVSLDTTALISQEDEGRIESNFTFGLRPWDRSLTIFQVQTGQPLNGDTFVKLAPSFVYEIKPGRHIELGVVAGVIDSDQLSIKLGTWRDF